MQRTTLFKVSGIGLVLTLLLVLNVSVAVPIAPTSEQGEGVTPLQHASPLGTSDANVELWFPLIRSGLQFDAIARSHLQGTLAFVVDNDIYVYQPETGTVRLLIKNGRQPQYSRDGTQLAFVHDDGLYVAAADGSNIRQIAAQSNVREPHWTDDGSKLVWERMREPNRQWQHEIWTMTLPNGTPLQIATGYDPAWAPDGLRVAYVTEPTDQPRPRNQLRLVNWRGENDWPVVTTLPPNTPSIGIPGGEIPPEDLGHRMLAPVWDAPGRYIYAPSFVLYQALSGFSIWERADATNGGSVFLGELPEVADAVGSPDRQAVIFVTTHARGDRHLVARALDPSRPHEDYAWAETEFDDEPVIYQAPTWSPESDAVAVFRCAPDAPIGDADNGCDLVVLEPGQDEPTVLIQNVSGKDLAWGRAHEEAVFRVEACSDQTFHVLTRNPQVIAEAEQLIGQEEDRCR
jgi:hypothetical protein